MWDLATCADGEPNVVPVAFKDVTEDGKLVVGDVFLETTLKNRKKPGRKQVYLHFVGSKRLRRSQRLGKCRTEIQIYLYFDGAVRGSCPHGYFRLSNGRVDGIRSCRRWLRRLQTDGKQGRLSVNGGRMRFTAAPLRNRERSVRVPCRPLLGRIPT